MEYTNLGNTDITISRFCLGCMGFGDPKQGQHKWTLGKKETYEIISYALDKGITFFDTAIAYQNGTSEQYVGEALRNLRARDQYVIATKFLPITLKEIENNISVKDHINNSINQSLKNLNLDYIDLYIYHMWDYHSKLEEIMEALNDIVKAGKARALGISNCFAWQLSEANNYALRENLTQFNAVQGHYNLLHREEEREMIPYCRMKNIALTPYSSLASGRLSKRPQEISNRLKLDNFAKKKYDETTEIDNVIRGRVLEVANKYNTSMTAVALSWLLSKVTSPIVGATKKNQVDGMIEAINLELSPGDLTYLEEAYIPHRLVGVMADNNPF